MAIKSCRVCGSRQLELVLDLGVQALTGVFPKSTSEPVTVGPLQLVKCMGESACGLLQLNHSYDLGEMYGDNYGYRSGLNSSMVRHLHAKVARILTLVAVEPGDLIIDIGSNDSTTLQAYPREALLVGIDPTGSKFRAFYPPHVELIPEFFSARLLDELHPGKKAKIVTSFSMFYDLPDPMAFMRDIHKILDDDGVWVFEQSYMPTMLNTNSYDTACHEHIEYYGLQQVKWMADRAGFDILDVEFNDINGGSFSVTVAKANDRAVPAVVTDALMSEVALGLDTLQPFKEFASRVAAQREELRDLLSALKTQGARIAGLGASTKGNVLLQYCDLGPEDLSPIAEVNEEKFGRFTPGTLIPIISEEDVLSSDPDYLLVLPWHFRHFFETSPHFAGKTLIFPLPKVEIVRTGSA